MAKPGFMTTEFYMMMTSLVTTWANTQYGWNIDPMVILGMFTGSGMYAMGRGTAKKK